MRIVVTGASGFLGSWISRILSVDHDVVALLRENSDLSSLFGLVNLQTVELNPSVWGDFILSCRPDVLVLNHWQGVGNSERNDPVQMENFHFICKLAFAAREAGVKTVIGVGSQAELGPIDSLISELAPDNPTSLYGLAKMQTRQALQKCFNNSTVRFVWMRVFSTYGPLDRGSWLIPNIADALLSGSPAKMTKGEQQWSYLHAYDLATAFLTAVENYQLDGIVNVGNPQTISIKEVGLKIGQILDKVELIEIGALDYRADQVMKLQPLCETLTNFGWKPQIAFDDGLKQTLQWLQGKELTTLRTIDRISLNLKIPSRR